MRDVARYFMWVAIVNIAAGVVLGTMFALSWVFDLVT